MYITSSLKPIRELLNTMRSPSADQLIMRIVARGPTSSVGRLCRRARIVNTS